MNLKDKAKELKRDIPALFLCLKSNEVPVRSKILAGITVAYALSPIDLIPDFIPVLGYVDDIILLPLLISLTVKSIPQNIFDKYRIEAEEMWKDGKPKRWYYSIPIIIIWILILWMIIKVIT